MKPIRAAIAATASAAAVLIAGCSAGVPEPLPSTTPTPEPLPKRVVALPFGKATRATMGCQVEGFKSVVSWTSDVTASIEGNAVTIQTGPYLNGPIPIPPGTYTPRGTIIVDGLPVAVQGKTIKSTLEANALFDVPAMSGPIPEASLGATQALFGTIVFEHTGDPIFDAQIPIFCSTDQDPTSDTVPVDVSEGGKGLPDEVTAGPPVNTAPPAPAATETAEDVPAETVNGEEPAAETSGDDAAADDAAADPAADETVATEAD